jgi:hypothetical protein
MPRMFIVTVIVVTVLAVTVIAAASDAEHLAEGLAALMARAL